MFYFFLISLINTVVKQFFKWLFSVLVLSFTKIVSGLSLLLFFFWGFCNGFKSLLQLFCSPSIGKQDLCLLLLTCTGLWFLQSQNNEEAILCDFWGKAIKGHLPSTAFTRKHGFGALNLKVWCSTTLKW